MQHFQLNIVNNTWFSIRNQYSHMKIALFVVFFECNDLCAANAQFYRRWGLAGRTFSNPVKYQV